MKLVRLFFLGLLMTLCSCTSVKVLENDMTLEELEARMNEAMDPSDNFGKAETFYQVQTFKVQRFLGTDIYEIRMSYKKPHFMRVTTYKHNERISGVIFNGNSAWNIDYKKQTVDPIVGNDFVRMKSFYEMANPEAKYHELFEYIDLTKCEMDDEIFYRLICKANKDSKNSLTIYVDSNNFLTRRLDLDFTISVEGVKHRIRNNNIIEAYDSSDDVMFPIQISSETNGIKSTTNAYLYQLDAPIDDSKFKPPLFPRNTEKRQLERMRALEKNM